MKEKQKYISYQRLPINSIKKMISKTSFSKKQYFKQDKMLNTANQEPYEENHKPYCFYEKKKYYKKKLYSCFGTLIILYKQQQSIPVDMESCPWAHVTSDF